jgi:hypothetical protein
MRRLLGLIFLLFFAVLYLPVKSAATTHEITRWRNNHAGAISLTFDDGYYSQPTTGRDLLNARNLKGTFFITLDSLNWTGITWDIWRSMAAQGHEIGSHSVSHADLILLSEEELRRELSQSQATINLYIPTQFCLSFAYPYGHYNDFVEAVTSEYYIAGRTAGGALNYYPGGLYSPVNFYEIGSQGIDEVPIDQLKALLDSATQTNAWLCVHIHDLKDSERVARFSQFLDEILLRDIWSDTYGTIVRYMRERIFSTLTVLSENESEITLSLSHSLDDSIYNFPLTIRSTVPSSWSKVLVVQGLLEFIVEPKMENGEPVVYYNAVPNAGVISLLPKNPSTPARIYRTPPSLSPSTVLGSNAPAQMFSVWNSGEGTLTYSISVDQGWLSCSPASGTSGGEQDTITINYYTASLSLGTYSATITITDPTAINSPQTIPVTLRVTTVGQASISRNPVSLSATAVAGSNALAQTFNVWNSGGGTLNYSIAVDQSWLNCSPASGTSTGEQDAITVSYNSASLSLGTYSATITITDPAANNWPQTIPVTLTITNIPQANMELNFEEGSGTTAYDISGNNNNGTLYGGVAYTNDHAVGSYALSFDGVDDRVICRSNTTLRPNDISVSLWVKHVQDTSTNYGGIILGPNGYGTQNGFRILDYQNKPLVQMNFGDASPVWISGVPFTLNEWTHIVLTYDHIKMRLYQNGQLAAEVSETRNINWAAASNDLSIGLAQWYFKGMIDKVVLFGSSLTGQQIQLLYNDRWASSRISQSPVSLSPSTVIGNNASMQTFNVWNSGGGVLNYSISVDQTWLSCSPASGASSGEQDAVTVIYSTASLASGTYTATIRITDAAASNSPQIIPVTLTVTSSPKASVSQSPGSLFSSILVGDNASAQTFNVWNSGGGTLDYSISVDQSWLSCSPASGTSTGEQHAITVSYSTASLSVGTHTATIIISDPAASNSPQTIPVTLTITAPKATISRNPGSLSPSIAAGSNAPAQTFNVWNSGGGTLSYSVSVDQSWLRCNPPSGTSTGEQDSITVSYSTASLSVGTHLAMITISDPAASNSPQTIPVTLTVAAVVQASISRNPSSLSALTIAGNNAQAQTFSVWNSGAATLNYAISVDQSWLSCSPASGTSVGEQDTITVSYSTTSLAVGTYSATITITDSAANNSPQTIPITLTVINMSQANMELNFEEGRGTTAYDTSFNNNNGSLSGGVAYTTDHAVGSYALSFDGVDDRVLCPSSSSLRPSDISVSLWIKHVQDTSSPNYGGIIQGPNGNGTQNGFRILDYKNQALAQMNFGDSSPVHIYGAPFTMNEWTHIALTYDHIKIRLYQNGLLVTEIPETRNINWAATVSNLSIGRAQWYFKGLIDKVMVFGTALTSQQLQLLYYDRSASSRISQSPVSLSPSIVAGNNAPAQTFNVWNSGGGALNYSISVDQTWLSCSPASGTSTGEQDAIAVSYSTASLSVGTYSATITITDPAASNSPQTIPVTLKITAPKATISQNPSFLSPSTVAGNNAPAQTFNVWNSGGGTLNYSISVNQAWLSCNPTSGTSTGGQNTVAVSYSTSSLASGTYTATITISDPAASNSPQTIPVTLTVTAVVQASISRNPSSLSANAVVGNNASAQTFNVWNLGGGMLNYSISIDQSWLSCNPTSGTSAGEQDTITVNYSTTSLSLGTYTATITISDPAAGNSPQTIPVTLTVTNIPQASMELNFEEGSGTTAYDTSGNNNNGALSGGVAYTIDHAAGTYALSFDGIDDRVNCPSNSLLRPTNLTVSFWVKHVQDTSTNYGGIIQGPNGNGTQNGFRILDYRNKTLAQMNFGDASPVWISGLPFTLNEWTHIVLTYDHVKIRLYQNGQLVIEIPETRNINWTATVTDLSIGRAQWYFKGLVDKVMIFGSALTAQQIQFLYNSR